MNTKKLTKPAELEPLYKGSAYTIAGCGGDLEEWVNGYNEWLEAESIGTPKEWFSFTGALVNQYAGDNVTDPFRDDITLLAFTLEGLNVGKLAMFRLAHEDRWFDDLVNNMVQDEEEEEDEDATEEDDC